MTAQVLPGHHHKRDSASPSFGSGSGSGWSDRESNRLKNVTNIIAHAHRKRADRDSPTTIDLSRTSAEHEGLGIYTSLDSDRSLYFPAVDRPLSPRLHSFRGSLHGQAGAGAGGATAHTLLRRRTDPTYGSMCRTSMSPSSSVAAHHTSLTRTKSGAYIHPMRQLPRAQENPLWVRRRRDCYHHDDSDDSDAENAGPATGGVSHFYADDLDMYPACFHDEPEEIEEEASDHSQSQQQRRQNDRPPQQSSPREDTAPQQAIASQAPSQIPSTSPQSPGHEPLVSASAVPGKAGATAADPIALAPAATSRATSSAALATSTATTATSPSSAASPATPKPVPGRTSLDGFFSRHGLTREHSSSSILRPSSNPHHHHKHHGISLLPGRTSKSEHPSPPAQDAATRAALIEAVRQDFEDREAAKDAKIERRKEKALERDIKRRERLEQSAAKISKMRLRSPLVRETSSAGNLAAASSSMVVETPTTAVSLTPRTPNTDLSYHGHHMPPFQQQPLRNGPGAQSMTSYESLGTTRSRGGSAGTVGNGKPATAAADAGTGTSQTHARITNDSGVSLPDAQGTESPRAGHRLGFRRRSSTSSTRDRVRDRSRSAAGAAQSSDGSTSPDRKSGGSHWFSRRRWWSRKSSTGSHSREVYSPQDPSASSPTCQCGGVIVESPALERDVEHQCVPREPRKRICMSPKGIWLWFITWFRTRLLKFARRWKRQRKAKAG
ncbi:hypothetical protein KEM52_002413 [Ascosphaera acerosa]|nr:hypothetical protein KEM52_002413 [Ascosphaera acerosa]